MNEILIHSILKNQFVKINAEIKTNGIEIALNNENVFIQAENFSPPDFLYGDTLMCSLDENLNITPIALTQHYATATPPVVSEALNASKKLLDNSIKEIEKASKEFDKIKESQNLSDVTSYINDLKSRYLDDAVLTKTESEIEVSQVNLAKKYDKPMTAQIKIGNQKIHALGDSGADISLIDSKMKAKLNYNELNSNIYISGINGGTTLARKYETTMQLGKARTSVEFVFHDNLTQRTGYDALIARNFMNYCQEKGEMFKWQD